MADQNIYNDGVYSNQEGDVNDSFLKELIDVEQDLHKFEMEVLRRKRLKVTLQPHPKKEWVSIAPGISPICNDLGVVEILSLMRGKTTKIGRLSKKTDEEIYKDMFQFHRALIDLFALRADEWELDEELTKPLQESILGFVWDLVSSSRGGFTAMNVKSSYTRHETATSSGDDDTASIMGVKVKR